MPPPSSGTVAILQTLGILERFELGSYDPNSAEAVHLVAEAYRLAYADRAKYVADADFAPVPVAGLLDPAYLDSRRALIRMDRSMGAAAAGTPPGAVGWGVDASLSLPSTSHVAVVDREGRVVNMTTTVEHGFGSLQLVRGFLLNNELTDFSLAPTDADGRPVANRVEPGKRPRSSMAPMFVLNDRGEVEAMVGAAGGTAIIQYVTRVLLGLIDWGMDVQQALDQPHFGAETSAATTLERGSPLARLEPALTARGHQVGLSAMTSGLQAIVFNGRRASGEPGPFARAPDKGQWAGAADPRREGTARGSDTR